MASQEDNSNQDCLERFQTSPVTASNLPDENLAPNQARVDWSAGQVQNRFTLLRANDGEEGDDQNEETGLYDPDRKHLNTPDGTVGPLERGLIKATI